MQHDWRMTDQEMSQDAPDELEQAQAEVTHLRTLLSQSQAALRPFAEMARYLSLANYRPDEEAVRATAYQDREKLFAITAGAFYAARDTLSGQSAESVVVPREDFEWLLRFACTVGPADAEQSTIFKRLRALELGSSCRSETGAS